MPDERTCGHCREPMRGYASAGDTWLCHPDEGLDCYRMVTVYKHPMPCFQCASIHYDEPRRVRTQAERAGDDHTWRNRYATVDDIQRAMKLLAAVPPPPAQCRMHPTAVRWMAAHASVKPRALGGPPPAFLGIPIIEDSDLPYGEWRLLTADGRVVKRGRFDQPPGPEFGVTPRPPRRRWWHRLTRRNP